MRIEGLYAILDVGAVPAARALETLDALIEGGARLVQLRAKALADRELLELARAAVARAGARIIVNDRADIARLAGAAGVHLGQDDLPPAVVRPWLSRAERAASRRRAETGGSGFAGPGPVEREACIGLSCHDLAQVAAAAADPAVDYLGFGPVFETRSKASPDPVVGLAGLAEAVRLAHPKPVVAIGGIAIEDLPRIRASGAAAAAMISALLAPTPAEIAAKTAAAVRALAP